MEGSSTADAVRFVTALQEIKAALPQWKANVEIYRTGQRVLERQRFVFPQDWLHVEAIEGEWSSFNNIYERKNAILQQQLGANYKNNIDVLAGLQAQIIAEDKLIERKIVDVVGEWDGEKPIKGDINADVALNSLAIQFAACHA